ncbi:MAG TPA: PVC-type heme-binding CxxCH protein [Gemmataceae bacterium]|nr:PVC-type heme-binding CxxCH protein [Gemmataceae bacterium]
MIRRALVVITLLAAGLHASPEQPPASRTHEVRLNGHIFTLPADFEIELAAAPPVVLRPIEADFDEQGRLYVTDSSGSNEPVEVQVRKKPHRVLRLEDTTGTGRFDKSTVFADRLMFPEGAMWRDGSLYVAAVPSIWKLTDTTGAGRADRRQEWFRGKTTTGCANDLHGPYAGPDGWIYWCKGAFARQAYERPGRKPFVTRAAHIFRCRPDGTGIEPVMNGGMDNPVEVAFTPGGERIFTTTFFQHPGGGQRDGLVHAIYGGVYGKDHDVIHEHPWTSPHLMPVLTQMGAAAPCGLIRYEGDLLGSEFRDNLFVCQFNMHKVSRHVLESVGATFRTHDEDFLVAGDLDFHPTDILEDADGSLLVIDTGGWYKLCCPTSQLRKPDLLGAIYRIRRRGMRRVDDPRGLKLAWNSMKPAELATLLGDPRPAVRKRAITTLAGRGTDALAALTVVLMENPAPEARRNALWALTRIDAAGARQAVRKGLADRDTTVRQVALHSISLWRDHEALPELLRIIETGFAPNRRAAAEAIGRLGDPAAVPVLLKTLSKPHERVLEHSLTYALIEIDNPSATAAGLASPDVLTRRAALTALDQMDGGHLDASTVAKDLASADVQMKETTWWIAGRHPDWGGTVAGFLRARLASTELSPAEREELTNQLARFARSRPVQDLLAQRLRDSHSPVERHTILAAMARSGLKQAPRAWMDALTQLLRSSDASLLSDAVAVARALPAPPHADQLAAALLHIGHDDHVPVAVRLNALAALPGGLVQVGSRLFEFLKGQLSEEQPVAVRGAAADVLAGAKLSRDQLLQLADTVKSAGPLELNRLLEAFGQSTDEAVGRRLIVALKESPARAGLREDMLKPKLAKFGPGVHKQAEELYALLAADTAQQRAHLEDLLHRTRGGDARRGQLVFNSRKAACSSCHAIGYLGGHIGPDLTRVGQIRSERDLLESIVYPSASFVRSYEPMLVVTKSGKTYNGLVHKDAPDEIVLILGADQQVHIPRSQIDEMQPGKVSIMPAGLDKQLSVQELADLVAFLKACK